MKSWGRKALRLFLACALVASGYLLLRPAEKLPSSALFTSLPIVWGDNSDVLGNLRPDAQAPHWMRGWLQQRTRKWRALDYLAPMPADIKLLILAQPRALSPEENVALDSWVRGGGRVLLFADPVLTQESAFALGDPRRPLDTAMLSPILARWNLRLEHNADQPALLEWRAPLGAQMPVALAGRLTLAGSGHGCTLIGEGLIADCLLGRGRALIVADAALLEYGSEEDRLVRAAALEALVARLRR